MAENKKSYVGYVDWGDTFDMLDDIDAGKLIKHFYSYIRDENPVLEDKILKIAFHSIKLQLKRDLCKWEDTKEEKSNSGKLGNLKRWNLDLYKQVIDKSITILQAEEIAKHRTAIKNIANIAVTVNDTVNVNEIEVLAHTKKEDIPVFTIEHCMTVALKDDRWKNATKATKESLLLFNKILEERAEYLKNPIDYKSHYANLKKRGGLTQISQIQEYKQQSTAPPLKRCS